MRLPRPREEASRKNQHHTYRGSQNQKTDGLTRAAAARVCYSQTHQVLRLLAKYWNCPPRLGETHALRHWVSHAALQGRLRQTLSRQVHNRCIRAMQRVSRRAEALSRNRRDGVLCRAAGSRLTDRVSHVHSETARLRSGATQAHGCRHVGRDKV